MLDKINELLVEGLKRAMAEPGEQRLYRSGKLSGIFAGRNGVAAEAAGKALREGLLEIVRTETKGKVTIEWVRPSPQGVEFVHSFESPISALKELSAILQTNREALPVWLAEMGSTLQALGSNVNEQAQRWSHRLEVLSLRVEEALRRTEAGIAPAVNGPPVSVPWLTEALAYLDRRRDSGASDHCPLPELFAALRVKHTKLSMADFHEGLRRLNDRRALHLIPFAGAPATLPEPEYALLDGATVFYYVTR